MASLEQLNLNLTKITDAALKHLESDEEPQDAQPGADQGHVRGRRPIAESPAELQGEADVSARPFTPFRVTRLNFSDDANRWSLTKWSPAEADRDEPTLCPTATCDTTLGCPQPSHPIPIRRPSMVPLWRSG